MIKVVTTVEIDPEMIADLMCTAFESGRYGCRYWMPKARPPAHLKMTGEEIEKWHNWYSLPRTWTPGHGHVVRFWEVVDESTEKCKIHRFEVDKMVEHLQRVASKDPAVFAQFLNSRDDPLDGPAADTMLQLMLLGEVVYG